MHFNPGDPFPSSFPGFPTHEQKHDLEDWDVPRPGRTWASLELGGAEGSLSALTWSLGALFWPLRSSPAFLLWCRNLRACVSTPLVFGAADARHRAQPHAPPRGSAVFICPVGEAVCLYFIGLPQAPRLRGSSEMARRDETRRGKWLLGEGLASPRRLWLGPLQRPVGVCSRSLGTP